MGFAHKEHVNPASPSYPLLRSAVVPADHVDNPYGAPAVFLGRPFGRASGTVFNLAFLDSQRLIGGLKGELDETGLKGWTWQTALTWHRNEDERRLTDILFDKFQEAVNSCSDPTDLSGCFNPWYSAIDGTGTVNSAEVVDYIDGQYRATGVSEMMIGDVNLSGPIVELPGGDLSLAIGAQIRSDSIGVDFDNDTEEENYAFWLGQPAWDGEQNVFAGYAEFSIPAIKGTELQAAVRAENYQDIETSVNPRFGLSWTLGETFQMPTVLEKLRLRGSVGTAFRAPNLFQTKGALTNLEQLPLPTGAVFRGVYTLPNPDLKSEKSLAFSGGLEWLFEGLLLDLDYWQYNVTDLIIRQSAQGYIAEVVARSTADGTPLSQTVGNDNIAFTPGTDNVESVTVTYANQDKITTNGIDFQVRYTFDLGADHEARIGAGGTYMLSYIIPKSAVPDLTVAGNQEPQDGCDGDECDIAGKRNENNWARSLPRLRMQFPIGWSLAEHSVNFAVNLIGSYDDDANYDPDTGELDTIDAWATLDLGYTYLLGETPVGSSTEFRVGVNNLLDAFPPEVKNTNFGYDIFTHDPRGRILYGNLTHKF